MCVHFKRHWVIKRNHIKEAITTNLTNQTASEQLKKEKVVIRVELKSLKMAYSTLKEQIQGIVF